MAYTRAGRKGKEMSLGVITMIIRITVRNSGKYVIYTVLLLHVFYHITSRFMLTRTALIGTKRGG